jgi:hypothetical protein
MTCELMLIDIQFLALAGGRLDRVQNEHRLTTFVACYQSGETVFILNTVS